MEEQFLALITDYLEEAGHSLESSAQAVATYAAQRAAHLSTLVADPGFQQAVRAERDNVAMYAAIQAGEDATAMDNRLIGLLQGALAIGATALAGPAAGAVVRETAAEASGGAATGEPPHPEVPF